jgi:hypothetical protein
LELEQVQLMATRGDGTPASAIKDAFTGSELEAAGYLSLAGRPFSKTTWQVSPMPRSASKHGFSILPARNWPLAPMRRNCPRRKPKQDSIRLSCFQS